MKTNETMEGKHALAVKGIGFDEIAAAVSNLMSVKPESLIGPGKEQTTVKARCLACYGVVSELDLSMTEAARRLSIALSTVSAAVKKWRHIADKEAVKLDDVLTGPAGLHSRAGGSPEPPGKTGFHHLRE